jgi:transposase
VRSGMSTSDAERVRELERENRELRRTNDMADPTGRCNEFCELL